jgi:hypothetical protein
MDRCQIIITIMIIFFFSFRTSYRLSQQYRWTGI